MTQVFADTFYLIALVNPSDRHHAAAVAASELLTSPLVTTYWVLVEVADALGMPGMRLRTAAFLRAMTSDPNVTVISPDLGQFTRGLDLYARRPDKAWSLTDCLSFVVMSEAGFTDALTGDRHFEQAGFRALLRNG